MTRILNKTNQHKNLGENRKMKTKSTTKTVGTVLIFAILVFFIYKRTEPVPKNTVMVEIGNYYDWNLSATPLSMKLKALISEPLVEKIENGPYVNRLITEIEKNNESESVYTVTLRESVYWSDKVNMNAEQVKNAYQRAKKYCQTQANCPAGWRKWFSFVDLIDVGRHKLRISGIDNKDQLYEYLANDFLIPIREDLIVNGNSAWKIGFGPYLLDTIIEAPSGKVDENTKIGLIPNQLYFRSLKPQPIALGVTVE